MCIFIGIQTNINHIHKLFSVFSLIIKINREKVCFPPMLHCQGPFIQSSIILCTTMHETGINTGINMHHFGKRSNH